MQDQFIHCLNYVEARCRSCSLIELAYVQQLIQKQSVCQQVLAEFPSIEWLPIQKSPVQAFRNRAKMAVSGSWQEPVLGVQQRDGFSVDLCDCPLYSVEFRSVFALIKDWITACQLTPYSVTHRTGELKFVLVSYSQSTNTWMIRWVLRSSSLINKMRHFLPQLLSALPALSVISVNIQPIDMAIIEGKEEIILTQQDTIKFVLNQIPFYCRPKSFFQTNDSVASLLYAQAQNWLQILAPKTVWDLFCGVGGFALHIAHALPSAQVVGIEIISEAIASAQLSGQDLGVDHRVEFRALSAEAFSLAPARQIELPECVIVNPPRRGIEAELCHFLNQSLPVKWILYSSCHVQSLAKDLALLTYFQPVKVQVFDMFPHTQHVEVLVLLQRVSDSCFSQDT